MSNQFAPFEQKPPPYYAEPPRSSGSGCGLGLLIGCLGTLVVFVLLCAGTVWYVQRNAGKWMASVVREMIVSAVNASEIPAGEKTEVIAQIDRVVAAYKEGKVKPEDLEPMMMKLEKSPAFLLMEAWGLEKAYVEPSGLPADEKEQGRRTIDRALRGLCEQKITQQEFMGVVPQRNVDVDVDLNDNGKAVFKQGKNAQNQLTDEEVRKMLADLKKLADDAGIPDEPFEIDIGDEVKKLVDEMLAGKPQDRHDR
ncbi:MAG: hypothetical protein L0211_12400 [Planctomycetaceae bacterium]|nr:hypothetical protein [Planctomycetaceae bacterium]